MRMTTRRLAAFSLAVSIVSAAGASAQEPAAPMAPFRGLFGPAPAPAGSKHALDFTGSLFGGYDQNVSGAVFQGSLDPRLRVPSWLAGGSAGLTYSRPGRRVSFGSSIFTGAEYLFDLSKWTGSGFSSGAGFGFNLARNTSLRVVGNVAYIPYYQLAPTSPLPPPGLGEVEPPQPGYFLSPTPSWQYVGSVAFSHRFSQRLSFGANYDTRLYDFVDPTFTDTRTQTAGAGMSYQFWKYASLRLGYALRHTTYLVPDGPDRSVDDHSVNAGVDVGRRWQWDIPLGPRTTLGFGFGTSFSTVLRDGDPDVYFNVVGNVSLNHWFNDRWRFSSGYNRSVGFVDGLTNQWVTDLFYARIGGYLNRRVGVNASSTYAMGSELGGPGGYNTWANQAGIQGAITSNLAWFGQYFYYEYYYRDTALLPGVPSDFNRQGFRVGLSVWVPLLR